MYFIITAEKEKNWDRKTMGLDRGRHWDKVANHRKRGVTEDGADNLGCPASRVGR